MKIKSAEFVISNTDVQKCPKERIPEYAFIGRSNVGKSSLINMLAGRKSLAKTSGRRGGGKGSDEEDPWREVKKRGGSQLRAEAKYLVDKGCIAVDGCSLTVCEVTDNSFAVWLIPHTLSQTNLQGRKAGDHLNIEFDLLAKYVERIHAKS